jgi:anti-sigma regulatory factor (Ser/Thr protein kinase)
MSEPIRFHYNIDGEDFTSAGQASVQVKKMLRQLDFDAETIRRVSVAMYEGEINMVIHANGGAADIVVWDEKIEVILADTGPGIPDVALAMQEGYSTAKENIRSLGFGAGMGLPNMKRYSDEMKIDTVVGEGTTVTMTFVVPS